MSQDALTSATLLARLRQPTNQAAWNSFVRLYTPLLFYWAHKSGLAEHDAADLVQDVLVVLIRKLPKFQYDARKSFRAWLRTVLVNTWRNRLRRQVLPTSKECAGCVEDATTDGFVELEETEYRAYLVARAAELMQAEFEETTWKACWQVAVENRAAADVACELCLSVNAVYLAKSRVLARLRQELAGMLDN